MTRDRFFSKKRISCFLGLCILFFIFIVLFNFFTALKLILWLIIAILFLFLFKQTRLKNFDFPIFLLIENRPKNLNLNYYINSPSLFGIPLKKPDKRFVYDSIGTIMCNYGNKIKIQYNPAYVCWYALINLNEYSQTGKIKYLEKFWKQVYWLEANWKEKKNGMVVWYYNFPYRTIKGLLTCPWISAMAQGLAISVLVRAYKLSNEIRYYNLAKKAALAFEYEIKNGGVRVREDSKILYQEYPINSLHVLDGFLFSLLGLYDLYLVNKEEKYNQLFREGFEGLLINLQKWDFKGFWSRVDWHNIPLNGMYNKLNICLLKVLYYITTDKALLKFIRSWSPKDLPFWKRLILVIYWFFI